jgi:hypothetical protein
LETKGGSIVGGALQELRDEIGNWYGAIAEKKAGLVVNMPEKPDALVLYEQVREMGIPLVIGGIRDQPHIWMMEYRVCDTEVNIWNAIQASQNNPNQE